MPGLVESVEYVTKQMSIEDIDMIWKWVLMFLEKYYS